MHAGVLAVGSAMALATMAWPAMASASEAESIKALERKLERSLQMIEALEAKVRRLEQASGAASSEVAKDEVKVLATPTAHRPSPLQKIEALEQQVGDLTHAMSRHHTGDPSVPLHGFADVGLGRSGENNVTKGLRGFSVGGLDLYFTPQIGERVKTLVELLFEVEADGSLFTDLERIQIGYAFSDAATGWLGRFHTPYGYWNTAFHHGVQLQTSLSRPRFLEFEDKGGILPAHLTGLWVNGVLPFAAGRLGYDVYGGNSPTLKTTEAGKTLPTSLALRNPTGYNPSANAKGYAGSAALDMQMAGATRHESSSGFNLWFEPGAGSGWRLGVHGLRATIGDDSPDVNRTRLGMVGAYATFIDDNWEALGEYYRFRNRDLSGATGSHRSAAGYWQLGYNFGRLTPYVRAERTELAQKDNYFAVLESGRSYRRQVIGIRFDLDPKAALKFEMAKNRKTDLGATDDSFGEAHLQYSIRF